jgi:site-specific DNA-cytosine methylase
MTRPTYGSLFSGVGGMDMGFDTHMDCVFQVEWDKHAQSILRRHWPNVPKWGDIQEVNGADLPPCDVLTFGSPCQDLSVAGKRAGLDGGRSSMFYEATRIIKEMRDATRSEPTGPVPRIAVWENVPGALSSNNGADFKSVIDEMVDIGACLVEWAVLDAQHFGVPQRRRRVFLIAIFDPATAERCPDPLLPVSEGRRGDFAKGKKKGQKLAGTFGGGSGSRGWSPDTDRMTFVPFVKARRAQNDTDDETWVEGEVTPTLNAFDNGGESRATVLMPIPIHDQATRFTGRNGDRLGIGKGNGLGIGEPGDPMNTLSTADRHAVAQPIVFDGTRHDDFRMDTEIVPTLKQRMGTGGGQVPMVFEPGAVGRLNGERYSEEVSHTLRANMGDNLPAVVQPVTVFQPGTMIRLGGGVSDDIVPTLTATSNVGTVSPRRSPGGSLVT